jgi:hypothetical protein
MGTTTMGKEEHQMESIVWKRGVSQKVLQKHGMKKKSVKSNLGMAERRGVKGCAMKLRSAETGGVKEGGMKLRSTKRDGG